MGISPLFLLFGMVIELDKVRRIIIEVVESEGFEPVEVELNRNRVLQVVIDQEGGISHSDCELISKQVGTVLDIENVIPSSYTLEVSSPGLERKLLKESDYKRFEGHLTKIRTRFLLDNEKIFRGKLKGLNGKKVCMELVNGSLLEIPLDIIQEARLEVDWDQEMARK